MRVVKVVKSPLDQGQHRDILSRSLGQEFFVQPPDSSYFDALDPDGKDYEQRLSRLAQDIAHILRTIESAPAAKTSKGTVYLAESSSDLKDERRRVLDELVAQGYRVLPATLLPEHVSDIRHEVEVALQQSALAIHLTGPRYGKRPEGTDESIVALQYELTRRGGLQRVVWVATKPEDTEAPQVASQARGVRCRSAVLGTGATDLGRGAAIGAEEGAGLAARAPILRQGHLCHRPGGR